MLSQSVSKVPMSGTDPTIAEVREPAVTAGQSEKRIEISTYTTKAGGTALLYPGNRMWAKVTLTMLTAGPVAVGEQGTLTPVLSGTGELLQTGVPRSFNVAKGSQLFIASTSITPVTMVVEAYPWLETITGLVSALLGGTAAAAVARTVGRVVGKLG